ncbi:hypothetical protein SESBI_44716, partial [Sesbania bispinosa]
SDNTRNGFATVSGRDNDLEKPNPSFIGSISINTHKACKEKCLDSSLSNENGLRNKIGASLITLNQGKIQPFQINETVNGDCILYDGKGEK